MFYVARMRAEDFSFAVQLANSMDWNMSEEDFKFMLELEPDGCFVLFENGERLGLATSISYEKVGWFGTLIVNENYRRKGAGTFLAKHAMNYLKNKGVETVGLYAYPHLVGFYEKLGFKPDMDFLVLQREPATSENEGTTRTTNKTDIPTVIDFDRKCFGASRGKLLEPILLNKRNTCQIVTDGDEIIGYVAAKVYDTMAEVGPLVCIKNHANFAVTLLKTMLSKLENLAIFICLPTTEDSLLETLLKAGFHENFRVTRMFLGIAVAKNCIYIAESLERG